MVSAVIDDDVSCNIVVAASIAISRHVSCSNVEVFLSGWNAIDNNDFVNFHFKATLYCF